MTDLINLLGTLVSPQGDILVKCVDEMVDAADADERDIEAAGASIALPADKVSVSMGRMRSPSLSIHSIEGTFNGTGSKSVIPARVSGKFSAR